MHTITSIIFHSFGANWNSCADLRSIFQQSTTFPDESRQTRVTEEWSRKIIFHLKESLLWIWSSTPTSYISSNIILVRIFDFQLSFSASIQLKIFGTIDSPLNKFFIIKARPKKNWWVHHRIATLVLPFWMKVE